MKTKYIIPLLVLIVIVIIGLVFVKPSQKSAPSQGRDIDIELGLETLDGKEVELADYFDGERVLVVNSWAVWCPFCKDELPDFVDLQKKYDSILVIAIDRNEKLSTIREYFDKEGLSESDLVYLIDPGDDFYRKINGFSMPETVFYGKDGMILQHKRGVMTYEEMEEIVNSYLN